MKRFRVHVKVGAKWEKHFIEVLDLREAREQSSLLAVRSGGREHDWQWTKIEVWTGYRWVVSEEFHQTFHFKHPKFYHVGTPKERRFTVYSRCCHNLKNQQWSSWKKDETQTEWWYLCHLYDQACLYPGETVVVDYDNWQYRMTERKDSPGTKRRQREHTEQLVTSEQVTEQHQTVLEMI